MVKTINIHESWTPRMQALFLTIPDQAAIFSAKIDEWRAANLTDGIVIRQLIERVEDVTSTNSESLGKMLFPVEQYERTWVDDAAAQAHQEMVKSFSKSHDDFFSNSIFIVEQI